MNFKFDRMLMLYQAANRNAQELIEQENREKRKLEKKRMKNKVRALI